MTVVLVVVHLICGFVHLSIIISCLSRDEFHLPLLSVLLCRKFIPESLKLHLILHVHCLGLLNALLANPGYFSTQNFAQLVNFDTLEGHRTSCCRHNSCIKRITGVLSSSIEKQIISLLRDRDRGFILARTNLVYVLVLVIPSLVTLSDLSTILVAIG